MLLRDHKHEDDKDTHYVSRLHTVAVTVPRFQIPRSSVGTEANQCHWSLLGDK